MCVWRKLDALSNVKLYDVTVSYGKIRTQNWKNKRIYLNKLSKCFICSTELFKFDLIWKFIQPFSQKSFFVCVFIKKRIKGNDLVCRVNLKVALPLMKYQLGQFTHPCSLIHNFYTAGRNFQPNPLLVLPLSPCHGLEALHCKQIHQIKHLVWATHFCKMWVVKQMWDVHSDKGTKCCLKIN